MKYRMSFLAKTYHANDYNTITCEIINKMKIFYKIMTVILASTMSVGFISCSENTEDFVDKTWALIDKHWTNLSNDGHMDPINGLEFKNDATYFYVTPDKNINGNYRIFEVQKSKGVVISNGRDGSEFEENYDGIYKMVVSGSNDFDQIWVYYVNNYRIITHFYHSGELIEKTFFNSSP
jgi:hypothetical protein